MKQNIITSFEEYKNSVNEGFLVSKRGRGGNHEIISTNAPVRTKILSFIAEKGTVSKNELLEYFSIIEEDLGKKPSWSWMSKNSHLVSSKVDENGETKYSLTKRGQRVLDVYRNYETLETSYKNSKEAKQAEIKKAKEILSKAGIRVLDESEKKT